jgi:hypothetical protein
MVVECTIFLLYMYIILLDVTHSSNTDFYTYSIEPCFMKSPQNAVPDIFLPFLTLALSLSWNFLKVNGGRGGIGLSYRPARARICERLWSPGIDSEESMPLRCLAGRTTYRVVVPVRQAGNRFLGSLKGLQIRVQAT